MAKKNFKVLNRLNILKGSQRQKTIALVVFIILFSSIGTYVLMASRAASTDSATLSLSPASSTISPGSQFTVTINESSSSSVTFNAVEADLTYDTSMLTFDSISAAGAFGTDGIVAVAKGGNGTVSFSAGASPSVSGNQTVATVTFTASSSKTGTTAVSFASSSAIIEPQGTSSILSSTTGGSYSIVNTAPPAVPSGLNMTSFTSSSISLSWTAVSGATGYKIYRDGTQVGTSTTNSYTDSSNLSVVSSSTTYDVCHSYTIASYNSYNTSAQSAASTSTTYSNYPLGDINGDGNVNSSDLAVLANNYLKTGITRGDGDLNCDGQVNLSDVSILAYYWNK